MFIAVDGTSREFIDVENPTTYDSVYGESYVRRLYRNSNHVNKRYYRGPNILSIGSGSVQYIRDQILNYIRRITETRGNTDTDIVLVGYSRGAAICITVAQELHRAGTSEEYTSWTDNLTISCLIMLDAVNKCQINTDVIPPNVARVFHVKRDPDTHSRECFGNTGLRYSRSTRYTSAEFMTSHAGVGGVIDENQYSGGSAELERDYLVELQNLFEDSRRPAREISGYILSIPALEIMECISRTDSHVLTYRQDIRGSAQVWQWLEVNVMSYISTSETPNHLPVPTINPLVYGVPIGTSAAPVFRDLEGSQYLTITPNIITLETARTGGIQLISAGVTRRLHETVIKIDGMILIPQPPQTSFGRLMHFETALPNPSTLLCEEVSLAGYERAHLWGPRWGDEAKDGIMYAPSELNQRFQNHGIESTIDEITRATSVQGGLIYLSATAKSFPRSRMNGLRGNEFLLQEVNYLVSIVIPNVTTGRINTFRVTFQVGHILDGSRVTYLEEILPGYDILF